MVSVVKAAEDDAGEVDWLREVAHQGALNSHHVPSTRIKHTRAHTRSGRCGAYLMGLFCLTAYPWKCLINIYSGKKFDQNLVHSWIHHISRSLVIQMSCAPWLLQHSFSISLSLSWFEQQQTPSFLPKPSLFSLFRHLLVVLTLETGLQKKKTQKKQTKKMVIFTGKSLQSALKVHGDSAWRGRNVLCPQVSTHHPAAHNQPMQSTSHGHSQCYTCVHSEVSNFIFHKLLCISTLSH